MTNAQSITPPVNYFILPGVHKAAINTASLNKVVEDVCKALGVDTILLYQKCKRFPVVKARWFVWKIMRSRGHTFTECAKMLGNHDHTSVVNAMQGIDNDIQNIPSLKLAWKQVEKYEVRKAIKNALTPARA